MSTTSENDPRKSDPRTAQRVDPKAGMSDDPRVDPNPVSDNRSGGDHAWEDELTEEDMPTPAEREDASHDVTLDP
jgi:hypothetical protein